MKDNQTLKQYLFHIALIGAFSIVAMCSSFYNGLASGNDLPQHYQFAHTIHDSLVTGEIYPSRADNLNKGYGDAAIRFYPPFAYYALSFSFILTGNWYNASLLTFLLIFWVGGIGVYLWAKEEFSADQSLIAAAIYIFAPYHINQIYNNFLYAEFAASAVIPFCFLFVTRVCRKGKANDVLGLSISFALLTLTHLPLSIIGSFALFIYGISLLRKESIFSSIAKLSAAVLTGLMASSFYWLRMITEMNWVKHSSQAFFTKKYDYQENFLFTPQNILNFSSDTGVLWLADLMLLATILISIPSIIWFVKNRRSQSGFTISIAFLFTLSVLMTTPLSQMIWDNLSLLQKVQFPWRWMGIVSMSAAVFASVGIFRAADFMNRNKSLWVTIGLGIILSFFVFTSAFIIKQAVYLPRESFDAQLKNIDSATSFDCWWTIWATNQAFQTREKITTSDRRDVEIIGWQSKEKVLKVSSGAENANLRIAVFYYPHWKVLIDEVPSEIQRNEDGSILISIPGKESLVKLHFQEPVFVKTAFIVSVITWLFLFFGLLIGFWQNFYAKPAANNF